MSGQESKDQNGAVVWLLVDHSARAEAFASVAEHLEERGASVEIVTISEVLGTMARDALAGSAERVLRGLRVAVQERSDEDLIGAVRRARPDVLVVTNARHVRALSVLEGLTGIPSLLLGVLPDFNLHGAWLKSGLHAFVVPHDEMAARLERAGVPGERVLVAGPAVQPAFARALDRAALRDAFGFSHSEKLIVARAEPFDVLTIEKIVFQAKLVEGSVRFLFHHNGDNSAANTLRRAANEYGLKAVMFGRVDDLERYLAISDMVVTAADDPLMSELIALGLPVMMVGKARDAAAQAEFIERHGMGRHVPDLLRLGSELERFLLADNLSAYTEAASAIGLPGGSREVAEAIGVALENAARWRQPGGGEAPRRDDGGGEERPEGEREERFSGGFESIGAAPERERSGGGDGARDERGGRADEFIGLSRAEAKEQLAQLILMERDLERRLGDLTREQQRWRNRLDLAREWSEDDLAEEAESILRGYMREAEPLQRELDDVRRQKGKLKAAASPRGNKPGPARGPGGSRLAEIERRFRDMEEDRDLGDLKDRIGRELGED